jgi:NTE family protein
MPTDPANIRTAIVLQGGGALGAYELGVLKAIYDQRPGFTPAAVSGVSIGAVTVAVLGGARGEPIATLETLWREKLTVLPQVPGFPAATIPFMPRNIERSLAILGNPGMYGLNPELLTMPWASTSIYQTGPLRRTLAELADVNKLNYGGIRVIVGAVDLETALIRYFDNAEHDLTFDAVVASGSLPPGFPMTEVGDRWYWDGGLFANTPLSPAINFLESCEPDNPAIHRELIVVELFPMEAPLPKSLPEVVNRMVQLQYTSRIKLDEKLFNKMDRLIGLIERVDAELPADSPLRADEDYRSMLSHRRIDSFTVITAQLDHNLTNAGDFSRSSMEARIQAGYHDATRQGVAWPSAGCPRPAQTPQRRAGPQPATPRRAPTRPGPDQVDGTSSAARGSLVRLSLKPSGSARGALDGAWWPRSTDPVLELVALSEEVGTRRARVRRIGLNMAGWDSAPRRIWLASGRRVAVDWFRISGGRLVRILGADDQWIDLLLIPVATAPASAELALTMATDGHDPEITAPGGHHPALVRAPEDA